MNNLCTFTSVFGVGPFLSGRVKKQKNEKSCYLLVDYTLFLLTTQIIPCYPIYIHELSRRGVIRDNVWWSCF